MVEDCPRVARRAVRQGQCTIEEANDSLHGCICYLNDSLRHCGSSDANHETLRQARIRYASTLDHDGRKERAIRMLCRPQG